MILIFFFF